MKNENVKAITKLVMQVTVILVLLQAPLLALAQNYRLGWSTIDGGGGVSSGGQYIVTDTIGQHDVAYSAGDDYELLGGFWPGEPTCTVDFQHFVKFAQYWLEEGSSLPADLYKDDFVDLFDLEFFVYEWLYYCPYDWPLR